VYNVNVFLYASEFHGCPIGSTDSIDCHARTGSECHAHAYAVEHHASGGYGAVECDARNDAVECDARARDGSIGPHASSRGDGSVECDASGGTTNRLDAVVQASLICGRTRRI